MQKIMKSPRVRILFIFLFFFCCLAFNQAQNMGNTVEDNLRYINEQCGKYNNLDTRFEINQPSKELILYDKMGKVRANFSEIEFRIVDHSDYLGIFCISEGQSCIKAFKKDGTPQSRDFKKYVFSLRKDGKLIEHAEEVVQRFTELKKWVVNGIKKDNAPIAIERALTPSEHLLLQVDQNINEINIIFQSNSQYKNHFEFDPQKRILTSKTRTCTVTIELDKIVGINYYPKEGSGPYSYGYYFEADMENIIENCTGFQQLTKVTFQYLSEEQTAKEVIRLFQEIKTLSDRLPRRMENRLH